jgi:hypothetical protein
VTFESLEEGEGGAQRYLGEIAEDLRGKRYMRKRGHPIFPLSREKFKFGIIES